MATKTLRIGSLAPPFENLKGVDGSLYTLQSFTTSELLVIVFSCNHCPYVRAYEDRMIAFQREFSSKNVALVAINSNDTLNYPEDSYEGMVERSKERRFNFPYLRDDDQAVAGAYGATHTPEFFLFDRSRALRYHGRFDDNHQDPQAVKRKFLVEGVESLLAGGDIRDPETHSIGCTIKWR